ncbi:MAG: DEAD/DEAH box helicase [Pseudomonadota bacterium]
MMTNPAFPAFFRSACGHDPHPWQEQLGAKQHCHDMMLRVPTGMGKTAGVVTAWAYHRCVGADLRWPTRMVFCEPMRVLVEQTAASVRALLEAAGLSKRVACHLLMGGADAGEWYLAPEQPAILIGTQDMLLSRALGRGYGSPRARWPVEMGLLNHDCLWVLDEIQLMDVGLATSVQLQAFRPQDRTKEQQRPSATCATWWMSATLQEHWLSKSPDTLELVAATHRLGVELGDRKGPLWDVRKPCQVMREKATDKATAQIVADEHLAKANKGAGGPTLVVLNRVERAVEVARHLRANKRLAKTEVRLAHSRFRLAEKEEWRDSFLSREACARATNRIVVATQVVEAGVDISAALLVTDLAPWPSLVQRFGRAARWGGEARIIVVDTAPKDERAAAPYAKSELDASRMALADLPDADTGPRSLDALETAHPEWLAQLYPYQPRHLLLRHEVDELFDTSPDLSGGDVDVSRFIRSDDERDVLVFWADIPSKESPPDHLRPGKNALCTVPFLKAREWLCGDGQRLKNGIRAWVWDWLDGEWRRARRSDLFPGRTVLVAASCGGYSTESGWSPSSCEAVPVVAILKADEDDRADATQTEDAASGTGWQTIATHGRQVGIVCARIARELGLDEPMCRVLGLASYVHDIGKAHPAFQAAIQGTGRPSRSDLAKAPEQAWRRGLNRYRMPGGAARPGFRHELASAVAVLELVWRRDPQRLLGDASEVLSIAGIPLALAPPPPSCSPVTSFEKEILALSPSQLDLLVYLVCSHHGKVRVSWHCTHHDRCDDGAADTAEGACIRIHGVRDGDSIPPVLVASENGLDSFPELTLDLSAAAAGLNPKTGRSWTERVLGLLAVHGPFTLAWLEALFRAADCRASRLAVTDPLLTGEVAP